MRMSSQQRQTIATAAAALDKSETDFMLDVTIHEAERVLADRRWFVIDGDDWDAFDRQLDELGYIVVRFPKEVGRWSGIFKNNADLFGPGRSKEA